MEKLNLPDFEIRLKEEEGNKYIFDIVRKKYLVLTPEEWVRQNFLHLLISNLGYPKTLIKMEFPIKYFKSGKRSDILIMKRDLSPFMLIECKAPSVRLSKDTLTQAAVYNKIIKADFLAVTNGLKHHIWSLEGEEYLPIAQFPSYEND